MGNPWSLFFGTKHEEESQEDDDYGRIVEQYASQVLDFSSQYGSERSYSYTGKIQ